MNSVKTHRPLHDLWIVLVVAAIGLLTIALGFRPADAAAMPSVHFSCLTPDVVTVTITGPVFVIGADASANGVTASKHVTYDPARDFHLSWEIPAPADGIVVLEMTDYNADGPNQTEGSAFKKDPQTFHVDTSGCPTESTTTVASTTTAAPATTTTAVATTPAPATTTTVAAASSTITATSTTVAVPTTQPATTGPTTPVTLPATGKDVGTWLLAGATFLALGGFFLLATRRA